ncbi:uncharacterized protein LOC131208621 [Anopheles bellator]|uniref:uncharacterized protein LOC131208621 n=1 Tax=Anopheles bellator TaxID=139047 RepID=UPI0026481C00|nr:uncharacterized protein LOC131208621 [Anopheles bellator]
MAKAHDKIIYDMYNPTRCNVCFALDGFHPRPPKTSIVCTCQLAVYCSPEHQALDKPIHSEFCQAVLRVVRSAMVDHILAVVPARFHERLSGNEKHKIVTCLMFILENHLKRPLFHHEAEMLKFTVACKVCFEYHRERLMFCDDCKQVAYCSKVHLEEDRDNHAQWCNAYRISSMVDNKCAAIDHDGSSITALDEDDLKALPSNAFELASKTLRRTVTNPSAVNGDPLEPNQEVENIKIAEEFNYVGSILYTLRATNVAEEIQDTLNVFIVGAKREILWFTKVHCAALFLYVPKLRKITLHFIGPQLFKIGECTLNYDDGRHVKLNYYPNVYHQLAPNVALGDPHLIAIFNCGFHENRGFPNDTWPITIQLLLDIPNVPIMFTSYTHNEALEDLTVMMSEARATGCREQVTVIKRGLVNPFRGGIPLKNYETIDSPEEFFYNNGYLSIIKRKRS